MDDCFDVFLDSVSKNFIEDFCIDIHKGNWSEVLVLCWVFMWFRYQSNCGFLRISWVEYLLFLFCGIVCEELELGLLGRSDRTLHQTHLVLGFLFVCLFVWETINDCFYFFGGNGIVEIINLILI